jgi:F0F1-type ATP synthase membrane subunit b/b'
MALLDNGLKPTLGGIAIGIGVAVAAPFIIPILASIVKPLTKSIIKGGLILYKTGKETAEEAQEAFDGLLEEAKTEAAATGRGATKAKKVAAAKTQPIAKKIVKEGKALYNKGKSAINEAKESLGEMVDEARAEIAAEAAAKEN